MNIVFYSALAIALGGLCFLFVAISHLKNDKSVGMLFFQAIISLAIGLGIMFFKDQSLHLFFILLGVWAVLVGIFQLVILVNIKRNIANRNFILFNGLLTIALGILMILQKEEVSVFVTKILGAFAILVGILMIYLSFVIRKPAMITGKETDPPAK
jgi:uncharacterized membrane protein HdeD (DUF308 family)